MPRIDGKALLWDEQGNRKQGRREKLSKDIWKPIACIAVQPSAMKQTRRTDQPEVQQSEGAIARWLGAEELESKIKSQLILCKPLDNGYGNGTRELHLFKSLF